MLTAPATPADMDVRWGKHTDMLRPVDQPSTVSTPAGERRWARIAERCDEYLRNRHG